MLRLLSAIAVALPILGLTKAAAPVASTASAKEPTIEQEVPTEKLLPVIVLDGATETEAHVMEVLQARGIRSTNALATVMGNIKQESKFEHKICEGGARVNYEHCHIGGYGLIQWTTTGRYFGLGKHARNLGLSPTSLEAQVSYIFREQQWRSIEAHLKTPGHSIESYMNSAYRWLGWGIHGARTNYSYNYAKRMRTVNVPVSEHYSEKFTSDHHYLK